jgi:hypothetical protein
MKWNYQYRFTLGLVILLVFAVSCKKSFSERVPINGPTDANFWLNEGEAISGVAGSYGQLRIAMNEGDDELVCLSEFNEINPGLFVLFLEDFLIK